MPDLDAVAAPLAALLTARGQTVGVAESSTGGLVSAALLAVPGASAYARGGAVVYTAQARAGLLGLGVAEMAGIRPSTEAYAQLLARTIRLRLDATWGIAETGATGPAGNRYGDPAGHSCLAVSGPLDLVRTLRTGSRERGANMASFGEALLALFKEALERAG